MKNVSRFVALTLTVVIAISLVSCSKKPTVGSGSAIDTSEAISIMMPSSSNEPYNAQWKSWQYVREATGAKLNIQAIPSDYETKLALVFTNVETMPDLMIPYDKPWVDNYAEQGAFLAIEDYQDQMPNWTKFWSNVDPKLRKELFTLRKSVDGKTYWPSRYGSQDIFGLKTWMYRKDIFDKHNIKTPKTYDELYDAAVKLKKLYPDSYPILIRGFFENCAQTIGPQWKPYFQWDVYYNYDDNTWHYGATEDTMLEMIKFFKKLYDEGLIVKDYVTMKTRVYEELIYSNKSFIFPQWQVQIAILNKNNRISNPDFTIAPLLPPPVANKQTGVAKMTKYNVDTNGFVLCNTKNKKRIANAVKLFDWFYSDQACELLSWGKVGETYEIKDGKKSFLVNDDEDIRDKYGLQTYGLGQRLDPEVVYYYYNSGTKEEMKQMAEFTEEKYNPVHWLAFNSSEQKIRAEVGTAVDTYAKTMISKFLLGQEPLSNWDSFVTTLKSMGIDQLLSAYTSAYSRVK